MIAFSGKPYEKLLEKSKGYKASAKVFTLPAVEVGSILEYRYEFRETYGSSYSPEWLIQSELFTRQIHYEWKPYSSAHTISWSQFLPPRVSVLNSGFPGSIDKKGDRRFVLDAADIPALPQESRMPPLQSLSYRVSFFYTSYANAQEYWVKEGKAWTAQRDAFIGSGPMMTAQAKALTSGSATQEQNLKKIYDAVQAYENDDYARQQTAQEEKAAGYKAAISTEDVVQRRRGSGNELTDVFVAMARAVGMKAYLMRVADRSQRLFDPDYLSLQQLDDNLAIVVVDGHERIFDPGVKYCPFGHLAWIHALAGGLRETDGGNSALVATPAQPPNASHVSRIGVLAVDENGKASGTVTVIYEGDSALGWRHDSLGGDDTSWKSSLLEALTRSLPESMETRLISVENRSDPYLPLTVKYEVTGVVGSAAGKRLLLPVSLFKDNQGQDFSEAKRTLAVDFHYPETIEDAVRFNYPESLRVESVPSASTVKLGESASYTLSSHQNDGSISLFFSFRNARTVFSPVDYLPLRSFEQTREAAANESLVLTRVPAREHPSSQ